MKLIRLQIEKLFDIFDYDIPIENKDNLSSGVYYITILSGELNISRKIIKI